MRYFLLIIVICLTGCKENERSAGIPTGTQIKADWLIGNWERINEREGIGTFEKWIKTPEKQYKGTGWSMKGSDTIFKEILHLVQIDNHWNLEVSEVNDAPTLFRITGITSESFISENETNEFPKKIEYHLKGEQLIAIISNPGREIEFIFKKIE